MKYTTPLAVSSQIFHCALPLRLDSYRGCTFSCRYCFARSRGGNTRDKHISAADSASLGRALERASSSQPTQGLVAEFLRARMPLHFGGMSDPFQPAEEKFRVSLRFLSVLNEFRYPTVISTRSSLVIREPYINLLQGMPVLVQFSLSTIDDQQAKLLEPLTPKPSLVLKTMRELSNSGVRVAARWQPYALHLSSSPEEMVSAVAEAGAKHLSLEHLKIPTELDLGTKGGQALASLRQIYKEKAAYRDGREFVLPAEIKLPTALKVRDLCHAHDMTFGAGDNDLQVLSDGNACCSGIDVAGGLATFYEYTMTNIVKRQLRTGTEIRLRDFGCWRPRSALDRFLNSKSRLKGKLDQNNRGVEAFLRHRWNGHSLNASPAIAYGISRTDYRDEHGNEIYTASNELRQLLFA